MLRYLGRQVGDGAEKSMRVVEKMEGEMDGLKLNIPLNFEKVDATITDFWKIL